ncbi:MAG: ABC transporter permease, partial [Moorea sp. SIO2I5]|nr:ABC transporter permease [Moorena sp. SIO2I5]
MKKKQASILAKLKLKRLLSIDIIAPVAVGILVLMVWDISVRVTSTPSYILPGPLLIIKVLIRDWNSLFQPLLITIKITVAAFITAAVSGL